MAIDYDMCYPRENALFLVLKGHNSSRSADSQSTAGFLQEINLFINFDVLGKQLSSLFISTNLSYLPIDIRM